MHVYVLICIWHHQLSSLIVRFHQFPPHPALSPSRAHPYLTVDHALHMATADTEIHLLDGVYPPLVVHDAPPGVTIRAAAMHEVVLHAGSWWYFLYYFFFSVCA